VNRGSILQAHGSVFPRQEFGRGSADKSYSRWSFGTHKSRRVLRSRMWALWASIENRRRLCCRYVWNLTGDLQLGARDNVPVRPTAETSICYTKAPNASVLVRLHDLARIRPAPLERPGPAAISTPGGSLQRYRLHVLRTRDHFLERPAFKESKL